MLPWSIMETEIRPLKHLARSLVPSRCSINIGWSFNTLVDLLTPSVPFKANISASKRAAVLQPFISVEVPDQWVDDIGLVRELPVFLSFPD